MRISRWSLTIGLSVLLLTAASCSFTTAHISSLKLSKDKAGNSETNAFAPHDSIYALATVSNVPSKVTLKFHLITEKVGGQPENAPVSQFDTSVDLPGDGVGTYSLSPPTKGWPAGRYRIDVSMLIESGEQKDQKSATFTVSGD